MKTNILKALTLVSGIYLTTTIEAVVNNQYMVLKPGDKRKNCVATINVASKNQARTVSKRSSPGVTQNPVRSKLIKRVEFENLLEREKPELDCLFDKRRDGIIFDPFLPTLVPEPKELVINQVPGLFKTKKACNDGRRNYADRWQNERLRFSSNADLFEHFNVRNAYVNTRPAVINYISLINAVMRI